jgi:DNA-binding response OmpR family regulator
MLGHVQRQRFNEVLQTDALEVRPHEFLAVANGRTLNLSLRELDLLAALVREQGRILAREELFRIVWGGRMRADDRSVDVYIHKLRVKLTRAVPEITYIHTHFGFGYRFQAEPSQPGNTAATAS